MIEAQTASLNDRAKERRKSGRWKHAVRRYFDGTGTSISAEPVRVRYPDGTVTWIDEGTRCVLIGDPIVLTDAPNWRAATHWIDNKTDRLMQKRPRLVETPMVVRHQCSGVHSARWTRSAPAARSSIPDGNDGSDKASHVFDRPLWRSVYSGEITTSDPMAKFEQPKSKGACCGPRCQAKEEAELEKVEVGLGEDQNGGGDAEFTNSESDDRTIMFVPSSSVFAASDARAATPSVGVVVGSSRELLEASHQDGIEMTVVSARAAAAVDGREGAHSVVSLWYVPLLDDMNRAHNLTRSPSIYSIDDTDGRSSRVGH